MKKILLTITFSFLLFPSVIQADELEVLQNKIDDYKEEMESLDEIIDEFFYLGDLEVLQNKIGDYKDDIESLEEIIIEFLHSDELELLQNEINDYTDNIESLKEIINKFLDSFENHVNEEEISLLKHMKIVDVYNIEEVSNDNGVFEIVEAVAFKFEHTYNEYDKGSNYLTDEYEIGDELNSIGFYYSLKNITENTVEILYPFIDAKINNEVILNNFSFMPQDIDINSGEQITTLATFRLEKLENEDIEVINVYFPSVQDMDGNYIIEDKYLVKFN